MVRNIHIALIALMLPPVIAVWGGFKFLGAHHWWDIQTAFYGAPIGLLIALLLVFALKTKPPRIIIAFVAVLVAAVAAHQGKAVFAASFGDNALAGQFWHFGWIGVAAGIAALTYTAIK